MAAFAAMLMVSAFVPTVAFGQTNLVNDLLKGVQGILGGGGGGGGGDAGGGAVTPQQATPPNYQPPLHGSDPHGQGTVGVADLDPTDERPLPANPEASSEDVIIGDSSGSQDANGDYHGRITVLKINLLDLLNFPALIEVETEEGETASGPLDPAQTMLLDQVCAGLGQPAACIEILRMDSSTTDTGSTNDFRTAGVNLPGVLSVGVAESHGSISEDANCQTANGSSSVANADLLGALPVGALNASSTSTACNDGTQTSDSDSSAVDVAGAPILGAACGTPGDPGSAVPNTTVLDLLPISFIGCAADDTNTDQNSSPYNVREALNLFLLDLPLPIGLFPIKVTTAGPESHAVAPGEQPPTEPPTTPPGDDDAGGGAGQGGDEGDDEGAGPAAGEAQAGAGELAFTGANLALLGLIGGALMFGGVMLARASTRRHRRATV